MRRRDARSLRVAEFGPALAGLRLLRPSIDPSGYPVLACVPATADGASPTLVVIRWGPDGWYRAAELTGAPEGWVQPLPSGELLVAARRSRRAANGEVESNAAVFGPSGELRRRFPLGDGIEDVQTAASGDVWVSYTLEGTMGDYGRHGWGRLSPEEWIDPVGYTGLVRFDAFGSRLQEFEPSADLGPMNDCYALNAWLDEAWVCYHPGFPVVRFGRAGQARAWETGLSGVEALATDGERLLLYSDRGGTPRCWAGQLGAGEVAALAELGLTSFGGIAFASARWVIGRGPSLHAFSDSAWYRLDLAEVGGRSAI